jgi:hypothetical protein
MSTYDIAGRTVTMPCVVRDASAGTALFDVDAAAARAMVPPPFDIAETAPGRCQAVIAAMATYSLVDGVPHRTAFSHGGTGSQVLVGGDGVRLELGDHPVA